jgi:hypothetical protein
MRSAAMLALALTLPAFADEGAAVYKKIAPSVVWIHVKLDRGTATGSGTLIDAERRLVLTNYHVVDEKDRAAVYFAQLRDGQPIAERAYYTDRARTLAIGAKVIVRNKKTDLAIIQLDKLPDGPKAVTLAVGSAEPGQSVHSIGNAGKSGALFGYVPGKVRQVYNKDWKADLGGGRIVNFSAKVVETDSATNPGDSGGPLLNDKGELVGVTEGGAVNAQLLSTFVDISEVKKLLAMREVKALPTPTVAKPTPPRDKPTVVVDGAKLLSADGLKNAQELVNTLHSKAKIDVLVETYASVPAADLDKVKAMKPEDRQAYMQKWLNERLTKENIRGFGVLVSADPRLFYVTVTGETVTHFPAKFPEAFKNTIKDGLVNKNFDEALAKALADLQANHGKN